jgi:serine/threonine protein kinase
VFVTSRGLIKILDFGLAKVFSPVPRDATIAATVSPLTAIGSTIGTVAYMSPEQARGEALDARSDLFSFGAVLYEIVTGRQAFQGPTGAVIYDAILNRQPRDVVELNHDCPSALVRVVVKALEKDRQLRFQSALEIRDAEGAQNQTIGRVTCTARPLGRFKEAVTRMEQAVERDPLNAFWRGVLASHLTHAHMYDRAVQQAHEALEIDPTNYAPLFTLGEAYATS